MLIGHSMGGLLARAALAQYAIRGAERIRQFIGIGAPHGGSMAAVQALRATYPVVCRLAAIDRQHDADTLTMNVFRCFLSLYQMLPTETPDLDLFESPTGPRAGARPDPTLLQLARGFSPQLAPADTRFISIVGTGQRTVTGLERRDQQFRYEISSAGDGTVAAVRATLPGAPRLFPALRAQRAAAQPDRRRGVDRSDAERAYPPTAPRASAARAGTSRVSDRRGDRAVSLIERSTGTNSAPASAGAI